MNILPTSKLQMAEIKLKHLPHLYKVFGFMFLSCEKTFNVKLFPFLIQVSKKCEDN